MRVHGCGGGGANEAEQAAHGKADAEHDQQVGKVGACSSNNVTVKQGGSFNTGVSKSTAEMPPVGC